jgi:signal transduction histidine kinase
LRSAIALRSCAVLVEEQGGWRLACAFGPPPARDAAETAIRLLGERSLVHLAASSALYEQGASLVATGVESVVGIESGGVRYGLLLLGEPQRRAAQSGVALEFARGLAAQAAIALRNARATAARVASERQAETGRVALGLAHDVGTDLGWMRTLVKRLPEQIGDPQRLARDATRIGELTDALAGAIERFVRDATADRAARDDRMRLDAIVESTAARVERLHGDGRVTRNLDPSLRGVRLHESLGRAIGNLLDNALHASPPDAPVRLVVTQDASELLVEIDDSGCGMSEDALLRVFEPGFTTRARSGGSGVGLPVAGGIVDALGGTLALRSGPRGTRASIRLPLPR